MVGPPPLPRYARHLFANVRFVHLATFFFRGSKDWERIFEARVPRISKMVEGDEQEIPRCGILHGGNVIPATKIIQVDLPPHPLSLPAAPSVLPREILPTVSEEGTGQPVSIGGTKTKSALFP